MRASAASVTTPHDLKVQQQVFEAVATVEEIFRIRGIHDTVSDGTDASGSCGKF